MKRFVWMAYALCVVFSLVLLKGCGGIDSPYASEESALRVNNVRILPGGHVKSSLE